MAMRPEKAERRIVVRAQALLFMADGVPASDIAMVLGVHERTVFKWRRRFECEYPATKLADAPRSGRPPSLSRTPIAR
jgi:transposase